MRVFEATFIRRIALVTLFVCLTVFTGTASRGEEAGKEGAGRAPRVPATLSLAEQEKLASELYTVMVKTDKYDLETFVTLHGRVINECPDTQKAQLSTWRLSNLYLYAGDKPDYQKIVELMEHLIERYPDSPIIPNARQRLLRGYEETGNVKKALSLYEDAFKRHPEALEDPGSAGSMIGYAKALAKTGNKEKAVLVYNKVLSFQGKTHEFLVDIARRELKRLEREQ